jgi:transposase
MTDKHWELINQHLPKRKRSRKGGRPPLDDRQCFEGILWMLWTGAPGSALPTRYGSKSAVHRRLQDWATSAVLLTRWRAFLDQLSDQQQVDWDECVLEGMFIRAQTGVRWSGRRTAGREHSLGYGPRARGLRAAYPWRRLPRRQCSWLKRHWPTAKLKQASASEASQSD